MQGEGLSPTDAGAGAIERLFALRDQLDEQRLLRGFDYLRVRHPVFVLPLDLGDSPFDRGEAVKVEVQNPIQVPEGPPEWVVRDHVNLNIPASKGMETPLAAIAVTATGIAL